MDERKRVGRSLNDISHYFISEGTQAAPKKEKPSLKSDPLSPLFLIGSLSHETRALLASNLACQWHLDQMAVELIEGEAKIPNAYFLMEGLFSEREELFSYREYKETISPAVDKKGIWNIPIHGILKQIQNQQIIPHFLVVLEPEKKKLMEAYVELRQAALARPDARFSLVVYLSDASALPKKVFSFFQNLTQKHLSLQLEDCGELRFDKSLAESILSRKPVVLQEEASPIKEAIQLLAQKLNAHADVLKELSELKKEYASGSRRLSEEEILDFVNFEKQIKPTNLPLN